jgi:hypothetical protein
MACSLAHHVKVAAAGRPGDGAATVAEGRAMHFGYIAVPLGALLLWMGFSGLRSGYGAPGNIGAVYRTVIGFVAGGLLFLLGLAEFL